MNKTREKLHSARATLDSIIGRRDPTTEKELDECVQTLDELRRACLLAISAIHSTPMEVVGFLSVAEGSMKEVADRIKNRKRLQ